MSFNFRRRRKPKLPICDECGQRIDKTKPGSGHSLRPPCRQYTIKINPLVYDYFDTLDADEKPSAFGLDEFLRKKTAN